jgi:hypothetical protein
MLAVLRVAATAAVTTSAVLLVSYALTPEAQRLLLKVISRWYSDAPTSVFIIPLLPAVMVVPTVTLTAVIIYLLWRKS